MRLLAGFSLITILVAGCGAKEGAAPAPYEASQLRVSESSPAAAPLPETPRPVPARKLIRTVDLDLRVDDTGATADSIRQLTAATGGYVSEINAYRVEESLHYRISIRIPVDELDAVVAQLKSLAVNVEREQLRTEDVTDQFVDLEAHLRTLRLTERELQALLAEARSRGSKADDIMTIYGYLTEIRTNIERLQGQLNALDNRATYSTVNLELVPTEAARPLTGDAWRPLDTVRTSLRSLMGALKGLADLAIILVIVVAPIALLLVLVVWLLVKAWRRMR